MQETHRETTDELRKVLSSEIRFIDDVLANKLNRRITNGGREIVHSVFDTLTNVLL